LARVQGLPEARKNSAFRTVWRRIYIHDDWIKILQTSNVTDNVLNERLTQTALYNTLQQILPNTHQPPGYDLLPSEALATPSMNEIASRWPGMASEGVESISDEYQRESERLEGMGIEDVYERVKELVAQEGDSSWS